MKINTEGLILPRSKNYGERNRENERERIHKGGFTLIELIVVMAVIGILVLLAAPKFLGYTERAQETKHIHTAKVIETALEAYLINGGAFPDELEVIDKTLLEESAGKESLIGVNGYVTTLDEETYYELTYDFIEKLDVKLSAQNKLFMEALASTVPTAVYASAKGIAIVDKEKTMKGYTLNPGELPNEVIKENVVQFASGANHSIVLMKDGSVLTWGRNDFGQLGTGNVLNQFTPTPVVKGGQPLTGVKSVVAGYFHSLALMEDGSVIAWGRNLFGELGRGSNVTYSPIPEYVLEGSDKLIGIKKIVAGHSHSLGLKENGEIVGWGYNEFGQAVGGNVTNNKSAIVKFLGNPLIDVKDIAVGAHHSFAILNDGTAIAWGRNAYGELGTGTMAYSATPRQVVTSDGILTNIKSISSGFFHTHALLDDGSLMSWGRGINGELGNGLNGNSLIAINAKYQNAPMKDVSDIVAGLYHSFAIMSDGKIMTWGLNSSGELGDGNTTNKSIPSYLYYQGEVVDDVRVITGGDAYSTMLLKDGSILSWGRGVYGQLGNGTTTASPTPVNVKNSDGTNFKISQ